MRWPPNANILILCVLLFLGFALRLYKFDSPVADWHSWRQADTSSVSKTFVQEGFNLLVPRYHDLSNVPSGRYDNPEGFRFVEFPIYNLLQGGFYKLVGILTLEEWGRLVTIFSSLTAAVFLYLIFSERKQRTLGLTASFFFLFIPFNIYYARVILPDMTMVMAVLAATFFFQKWLGQKQFTIYNLQFTIYNLQFR